MQGCQARSAVRANGMEDAESCLLPRSHSPLSLAAAVLRRAVRSARWEGHHQGWQRQRTSSRAPAHGCRRHRGTHDQRVRDRYHRDRVATAPARVRDARPSPPGARYDVRRLRSARPPGLWLAAQPRMPSITANNGRGDIEAATWPGIMPVASQLHIALLANALNVRVSAYNSARGKSSSTRFSVRFSGQGARPFARSRRARHTGARHGPVGAACIETTAVASRGGRGAGRERRCVRSRHAVPGAGVAGIGRARAQDRR